MRPGCVYILTNARHTVLYVGVTSNLAGRIWQHKAKASEGFSKRYNVDKLVWYECGDDIESAIAREKQIKGGSRQRKLDLINAMNPEWRDLYDDFR
jgi:putative endonuclease